MSKRGWFSRQQSATGSSYSQPFFWYTTADGSGLVGVSEVDRFTDRNSDWDDVVNVGIVGEFYSHGRESEIPKTGIPRKSFPEIEIKENKN